MCGVGSPRSGIRGARGALGEATTWGRAGSLLRLLLKKNCPKAAHQLQTGAPGRGIRGSSRA